ncbi:MAG: helix-turn-helix domain-containing protein [Clostridia bacterium]|jgi:repressor LexA|nr:helix-turn-helix domain-containing protein [Clostridia bacterium]
MYDLELWKARKKELKLTLDDISERTGIGISTIKDIFRGATYAPRIDTVQAIEQVLELADKKSIFDTHPTIRPVARRRIPMLGEIACGEPIYANEERESYVEVGTDLNVDFCLTARGDSMIGARIKNGDIIFCRSQDMVNNGEIAAVIIGDEVTLKRVYYYPDKQKLVLQAENPKYEPFVYVSDELNQIRILGKAVAFQSDIE